MILIVRCFFLALAAILLITPADAAPDLARHEAFVKRFSEFEAYDPPKPLPFLNLRDLSGEKTVIGLSGGQWVLVNFWAVWCPPCVEELPTLQALREARSGDDFNITLISLDFPDSASDLRKLMTRRGIAPETQTLYTRDTGIWDQLSIAGVPTTLLIGPDGAIHYKLVGDMDWSAKETLAFIDDLLNN